MDTSLKKSVSNILELNAKLVGQKAKRLGCPDLNNFIEEEVIKKLMYEFELKSVETLLSFLGIEQKRTSFYLHDKESKDFIDLINTVVSQRGLIF